MIKPKRPQNPFYSSPAWRKIRLKVLNRDGWRCTVCGGDVRPKTYARVDHIVPMQQRPDLALLEANLRTLCGVVDPVAGTQNCDAARHREKGRDAKDRPIIGLDGFPAGW